MKSALKTAGIFVSMMIFWFVLEVFAWAGFFGEGGKDFVKTINDAAGYPAYHWAVSFIMGITAGWCLSELLRWAEARWPDKAKADDEPKL